jgi:hypothetical protein
LEIFSRIKKIDYSKKDLEKPMIRNLILALNLLFFSPSSFGGVHMPCNNAILEQCYKPQPCGVGNKDQEKREECEDTCIKSHKLESTMSAECRDMVEDNDRKGKKTSLPSDRVPKNRD